MRTCLLVTATILLSGCGAFGTNKKGQKADQIDQDLTGRWSTSCLERGFIFTKYQRDELNFSALGDFEKKAIQHVDSACSTESLTKTVSGSYDLLGNADDIEGGKNINFTVRDVVLTAHTAQATQALNDTKTCGLENWIIDESNSVLGKNCGETFQDGAVIFDIIRRDQDTVWLGKSFLLFDDKDAPGDRPTTLELDRSYKKQ